MMYYYIGISFLAGLIAIFFTSGMNYLIGKFNWRLNKKIMEAKDKRTRATNELFSSIKFIKINALEEFFIARV